MYERHEQWMTHYGRVYKDDTERATRYSIFKENVARIDAFNTQTGKSYKLGVNQFADLTNEEFKASRNRFKGHMCSPYKLNFLPLLFTLGAWRSRSIARTLQDASMYV